MDFASEEVFFVKIIKMVATVEKVNYEQFREMEVPDGDTHIYELINGEIVKRASPNSPHQRLSMRLIRALDKYIFEKELGELFHPPLDVVLDDENVPQPDLIFISKERDFIIPDNGPIIGAPDLVVEILSPSTAKYDRGIKKDLYEKFQVKEYWIADPVNASIEVYEIVEGRYKLVGYAAVEGTITSSVIEGLELEMKELFA